MPQVSPDKVIVSNGEMLKQKYGAGGSKKVLAAVKKLIAADKQGAINTAYVDLSDAATMAAVGAAPIPAASASDANLNKEAIDKVYAASAVRPSDLLLLGATDVIPHVPL